MGAADCLFDSGVPAGVLRKWQGPPKILAISAASPPLSAPGPGTSQNTVAETPIAYVVADDRYDHMLYRRYGRSG